MNSSAPAEHTHENCAHAGSSNAQHTPSGAELRVPGPANLAVLGKPIAHSKSPIIHSAAYAALALPWHYDRFELDPEDLDAFLSSRDESWRGFSLTMPLKEEAARLSTVLDPVAENTGVVNTVIRLANDSAGKPRWAGFNTDVAGLAAALKRAEVDPEHSVVLGSGATAISAVLAARAIGAQRVTVAARRIEAAQEIADRFDVEILQLGDAPTTPATLVISTLPGPAAAEAPTPDELLAVPLFDCAYDPWPSPFAERWRLAGSPAHAGLEMLVEQALVQIRIFTNGDPNTPIDNEQAVLDAMRAASMER